MNIFSNYHVAPEYQIIVATETLLDLDYLTLSGGLVGYHYFGFLTISYGTYVLRGPSDINVYFTASFCDRCVLDTSRW
jgi:hypothetical protein